MNKLYMVLNKTAIKKTYKAPCENRVLLLYQKSKEMMKWLFGLHFIKRIIITPWTLLQFYADKSAQHLVVKLCTIQAFHLAAGLFQRIFPICHRSPASAAKGTARKVPQYAILKQKLTSSEQAQPTKVMLYVFAFLIKKFRHCFLVVGIITVFLWFHLRFIRFKKEHQTYIS